MFGYMLSVFVAAFVYGILFNLARSFNLIKIKDKELTTCWVGITVCAIFWFISLPIGALVLGLYLIKKLSDTSANKIKAKFDKNKDSVGGKDSV